MTYNINPETDLTTNFKYKEFWSNSLQGIKIEPPEVYYNFILMCATELQRVRDVIKKPIYITSGYRTKEWNSANGGAKSSFHLKGMAVDTRPIGMKISDYLYYILRYTSFNGIGLNIVRNFIHTDLRDTFTIIKY